jgi:hypothetical protein
MIIYDFDIIRVTIGEAKTDTPLVINSDRVLPGAIAAQKPQAG